MFRDDQMNIPCVIKSFLNNPAISNRKPGKNSPFLFDVYFSHKKRSTPDSQLRSLAGSEAANNDETVNFFSSFWMSPTGRVFNFL
jgi:hypothetical protein